MKSDLISKITLHNGGLQILRDKNLLTAKNIIESQMLQVIFIQPRFEKMKIRIRKKFITASLKWTGITVGSLIVLFFIFNWIFPLPDRIEYSTIITDNKGEVINAYLTSDQKWRMKTELDEISPLLRKTIIAKEDKYFYSLPGVNAVAITRAFFKNIFRM
jgi:membrane peptidoglycan carboxypeptidase